MIYALFRRILITEDAHVRVQLVRQFRWILQIVAHDRACGNNKAKKHMFEQSGKIAQDILELYIGTCGDMHS